MSFENVVIVILIKAMSRLYKKLSRTEPASSRPRAEQLELFDSPRNSPVPAPAPPRRAGHKNAPAPAQPAPDQTPALNATPTANSANMPEQEQRPESENHAMAPGRLTDDEYGALRRQVLILNEDRKRLTDQLEQTKNALAETETRLAAMERSHARREHEFLQQCAAFKRNPDAQTKKSNQTQFKQPTLFPQPSNTLQETTKHPLPAFAQESMISRLPFRKVFAGVIFLSLIAFAGIFLADMFIYGRSGKHVTASSSSNLKSSPTLPDVQARQFLPGTQPALIASLPDRQGPTPLPWPKLPHLRGARITTNDFAMNIIFDEGLFEHWVDLSPSGRTRLQALGRVLRGRITEFNVVVEGHTDPGPLSPECPYSNNEAIALVRARVAAAILCEKAEIPEGKIRTVSRGDRAPPHSNATPEMRARNRTVVIKIEQPGSPAIAP